MEGSLVKKGKYYYAVIYRGKDENGKQIRDWHNTKCEDKKEAEKKKREILTSLDKGMYVEPHKKSFSEFILQWLDEDIKYTCEPTTYESYKQTINKHIVPYFKSIELQKLQPIDIKRFYNSLQDKGLSANTVKHHHANIHKCLDYAVKMNLISINAADRVDLPKIDKFKTKTYSDKQLFKLWDIVKDTYIETPVRLAITLGVRRGEALGLKWYNVDFENRIIHIDSNRVRKGNEIILKETKTEASNREIAMPDELFDYLKQLQLKQKQDKKWFSDSYSDENWICCKTDGTPLDVTYVSRMFSRVLAEKTNAPH